MWDLLGPGLEPVSPALASGFLTTAPAGKSAICTLIKVWTSCENTVERATNSTWGNWEGLPTEGFIWFMALKISRRLLGSEKEKGHSRQKGNMNQVRRTNDC